MVFERLRQKNGFGANFSGKSKIGFSVLGSSLHRRYSDFHEARILNRIQGCQIFLGTKYQNGKNIPNYHKLYQMSMKYNKCRTVSMKYTNIYHCKTLLNFPKFGFLVWKQTIWQPWSNQVGKSALTTSMNCACKGTHQRKIKLEKITP
jgi:hypothetical protein